MWSCKRPTETKLGTGAGEWCGLSLNDGRKSTLVANLRTLSFQWPCFFRDTRKGIMDRESPERKTQAECACARVCRGDDNKAPDEKMLHPCDKRELQDLGFAAASQSSRHCVKMPQIKLIKRKAIMLVCQPDRWHSTALEVGHPSNSSDDGPLPALPRPPHLHSPDSSGCDLQLVTRPPTSSTCWLELPALHPPPPP